MKLINPSVEILTPKSVIDSNQSIIEQAGRTCYKSESKITDSSSSKFIEMIIRNGHTSVLEHSLLTVKFITDRAIANELVRHRHSAFSQESTRYCNYGSEKFEKSVTFIKPFWYPEDNAARSQRLFKAACLSAEDVYLSLLAQGIKPENARCVLPLCTKTELVMSASYREWRNVLKLRLDSHAHPEMNLLMRDLLNKLKGSIPVVFDDIDIYGESIFRHD